MPDLPYTLVLPEGFVRVPLPGLNAWVTALRSGEYRQNVGAFLCDHYNKYCCLGVLSATQGRLHEVRDLTVKFDGNSDQDLADDNPCYPVFGNLGQLPCGVRVVFRENSLVRLSQLNDQGMTFAQIAEVLVAVYVDAAADAAEGGGAPVSQPLPTTANDGQPLPTSSSSEEVRA